MIPAPPFRQALLSVGPLLSTFSIIPSPVIVELAALAGFDSIIVDLEHGPFEIADTVPMILAARARGIQPIVRVRANQAFAIGSALDVGAAGVIVPQVDSVEGARAAVSAARFAPVGSRGVNPWVRAFDYTGDAAAFARVNEETAIILLIEGKAGIDAVPGILDAPGVDCLFLGPVDMAQSLGVGGQPEHPAVVAEIERIVTECRRRGVATAVFATNGDVASRWLDRGVALVAVAEDTAIIADAYRRLFASIRRPG
ncbi:MAG: aldolase [Alphaproteobacteria bacterium]|nr:aldolase [Alphaproteobacteria bacterium]